jgi:hypothetical protein
MSTPGLSPHACAVKCGVRVREFDVEAIDSDRCKAAIDSDATKVSKGRKQTVDEERPGKRHASRAHLST